MVLVDASVWIEFFRPSGAFRIQQALDLEEIVTCLPVIQEVLQGFDDQNAYLIAREAMFSFPVVEFPMTEEVLGMAVDLFRSGRRAGLTIRSSVDCLIAACALRSSLTVLHKNRDFDSIARIAPLRLESIANG